MKKYRRKRWKSVDSTHIFIQFASDHQCCTDDISVVPQDISVKATHRVWGFRVPLRSRHFLSQKLRHFQKNIRSCVESECSWWRHQMEPFSALLALCAGNSPVLVNSPHKGQWRGALMFSLICARINGWVNNGEAGDLRRQRAHYDVIVMCCPRTVNIPNVIFT